MVFLLNAGTGTAAEIESKDTMKHKELKALVLNAKTPADHMKLSKHFMAMAEKHEAEAKEHEALALEYAKSSPNPKMPMAPNTSQHCKVYAEHCRKAAAEMRAMAAAHVTMSKSIGK